MGAKWLATWCRRVGAAAGVAGMLGLLAGAIEFGLVMLTIFVIGRFSGWVMRRALHMEGLLLLAFLGGYLISWCIGLLGFRYVLKLKDTSLSTIGEHTSTTAALVLLSVLAFVLGGGFVLTWRSLSARSLQLDFNRKIVVGMLLWFGAIYLIFEFFSLSFLGLNARTEIGNFHAVGSDSYLIAGFNMVAYPFYVLLGISFGRRVCSGWNLMVITTVLLAVGIQSLTGGRSAALEPLLVTFIGVAFSELPWRKVAYLGLLSVPLIAGIMIVIGMARGTGYFSGGSVRDKVAAIATVIAGGRSDGGELGDPIFNVLSRIFEPSGQVVIDHAVETGTRVHFLNFDRLTFVLVPQFIYPAKKPLNDGNERLENDYGYSISEYSSAPLTLIADAYERFGYCGVFGFHLLAGAILAGVAKMVCRMRSGLLAIILLAIYGRAALLLYPESCLGFFHIVVYAFLRDWLVISCLFVVGSAITRFFVCSAGHPPSLGAR